MRLLAEKKVLCSGYASSNGMHGVTPGMGDYAEGLGDLGDLERGVWSSLGRENQRD